MVFLASGMVDSSSVGVQRSGGVEPSHSMYCSGSQATPVPRQSAAGSHGRAWQPMTYVHHGLRRTPNGRASGRYIGRPAFGE
jgi:hypothetical protein